MNTVTARSKIQRQSLIAKADVTINAPVNMVWDALINPKTIKKYMFGATVTSDWKEGAKISWKGEWGGKAYEDKGVILQLQPKHLFKYSHFSPLSGDSDTSDNYHNVTITLTDKGKETFVFLTQDNNQTELARDHSEKNWKMMLESMKKILENN